MTMGSAAPATQQPPATRIRQLAPSVVSQIAAGEVVERPASAVKELIENAIDSGASRIEIELIDGGNTRMRVKDDGCGIPFDQLKHAVQPHMTSKLSKLADLDSIATLGFRGEALAAMSSLTNLTLSSRTAAQAEGGKLELKGTWYGETPRKHVMAPGTIVELQDMFLYAPARRKFLRKPHTEWAYCDVEIRRQMVAHPEVGFAVGFGKGKRTARSYGRDPEPAAERAFAMMGSVFAAAATPINYAAGPLRIHGHVNFHSRGSSSRQFFFVNGRAVNDSLVKTAIRQALAEVNRIGLPPFALFLHMPASLVDVNAHPAKTEVRYKEPNAVFSFIHAALSKVIDVPLGTNPLMPFNDLIAKGPSKVEAEPASAKESPPTSASEEPQPGNQIHPFPQLLAERFKSDYHDTIARFSQAQRLEQGDLAAITEAPTDKFPLMGRAIGMLHGLYLVAESEKGLMLVDIHAAHERILFEELKEQYASNKGTQALIEPIVLELDEVLLDTLDRHRKTLAEVGLEITKVDGREELTGVPGFLAGRVPDYSDLLIGCAQELAASGTLAEVAENINRILATTACHMAVRGTNPYKTREELNELLRKMETTMRSGKCNHGRPVWRMFAIEEIDKFFERGR